MSTRTRWGTTKSGRSPFPGALGLGLLVAGAIAVTSALIQDRHETWLYAVIMFCCLFPVAAAGGWVILVDRSSIAGAASRPEESVESAWYDRAASGAFHDLIVMLGVGAAVFSIVPALQGVPAYWALLGLGLAAGTDMAVRYITLSRRAA